MAGSLPSPNLKVLNREKETASLWRRRIRPRGPLGTQMGGGWFLGGNSSEGSGGGWTGGRKRSGRRRCGPLVLAALPWAGRRSARHPRGTERWQKHPGTVGVRWALTVDQQRAPGPGVGTLAHPSSSAGWVIKRAGEGAPKRGLGLWFKH